MEEILKNINNFSNEQIKGFISVGVIDVEDVIDVLQDYDAVQIACFIKKGLIQPEDMEKNNEVNFKTRKKVKELLEREEEQPVEDDDSDFEKAKELNIPEAFQDYLDSHPDGKHREEARALKRKVTPQPIVSTPKWRSKYDKPIEDEIRELVMSDNTATVIANKIENYLTNGNISMNTLVGLINQDKNLFSKEVIRMLFNKGIFNENYLEQIGFGEKFIEAFIRDDVKAPTIPKCENPKTIDKLSTEVYFWGIPSSGKSCVMAALMSVVYSGDIGTPKLDDTCCGYGYMEKLAGLYKKGKVKALLPGNAIDVTYEMAFDLTRESGKRKRILRHPFTFIDLAGGVIYLMHDFAANKSAMSESDIRRLDEVTQLINGQRERNRKMHCFVIEYGADEWRNKETSQLDYLTSALNYIDRTKIFNKATDSIYVIVTKADRAKLSGVELQKEISNYVKDGYYKGFYKLLKEIVTGNEINGGQVPIFPFSIGRVEMRSLCMFNDKPASVVMDKIIERSFGIDDSRRGKIVDGFRN